MPTAQEIQRQIDALDHAYVFWTGKEIRSLPSILDEDERILALTSGFMDGHTWLAVCTQRRLLFINCGMFFGLRQVQLRLDKIQSIDHEHTIYFGSIRVWDGASYFTISMVAKHSVDPFVKTTEDAMESFRQKQQQKTASGGSGDLASQLERLAALRDKGVLTDAEFQAQKLKLLA